eukprot:CAMPEP_0172326074 /NCGR_PEP_ID=MMETSP1058-20130122/55537_1 /TAXON_ID=83371 /ORGANISM="Detonula confervacea, Strain CCMP 353" /LENGTH=348 /DNA_ID=CAMNT_0013042777 /DNA_START=42 /DNA_END=1084 /DNA_ORIENTATION=-
MIYANLLGLSVLGSALTQSNGRNIKTHEAAPKRELGTTSSYNEPSVGIPANTCLTETQCNMQRKKMGFDDERYYVDNYHHHGCFYKNSNAFWGRGGTAAQKSMNDLPGIQTRIWCDDGWKEDGWNGDGYKPTLEPTLNPTLNPTLEPTLDDNWKDDGWDDDGHEKNDDNWKNDDFDDDDAWKEDGWKNDGHAKKITPSPTLEPTLEPTSWKNDSWNNDGHDVCLTLAECNSQRKKMGIAYFEVGSYDTFGCFSKLGEVYWGKGGTENEMGKDSLSGHKSRIYCKSNDDGWDGDGHTKEKPTFSPTLSPTLGPIWKDDGWKKDGWEKDGWEDPTLSPTLSPSFFPTAAP